jgi:hypothetical protein
MCESYESTMGIYLCGESWLQPRYRFRVFMCISRSWGLGDAMGVRWGVGVGVGMGVGSSKSCYWSVS